MPIQSNTSAKLRPVVGREYRSGVAGPKISTWDPGGVSAVVAEGPVRASSRAFIVYRIQIREA